LPKACPTARILSFGYNSSFVSFFPLVGSKAPVAKETTVDDYSSNLLHELSTFRNSEENPTPDDRPIIFVAHSLGGLVVANAVARQHGIDTEAKKLSDSTVGMLFLGTPFEGSKKAEWGKLGDRFKRIIPGIKTEDIKNLEERSAKLESINIALNKYVKERDRDRTRRPLNIVCYFEEHPTYEAGLSIGKIVKKPSATTLPAIPAFSIDADHQDMCKFAGDFLRGYQSVSGQLVQWVKDLKKKLPADTDAANVVRLPTDFH
jgi:predicted alpha/beta hydrolase family esterase